MSNKRVVSILAGLAVLFGGSVPAVASSWTNASGSNARFGWSGGENNTDHFGNPTVTTDGFFFTDPDDFIADVDTGILSVTDFARVTVDVAGATPNPASPIPQITVREWGTFAGDLEDLNLQADFVVFRYSPMPPGSTSTINLPNDATVFDEEEGTWFTEYVLTAGEAGNPPYADQPWSRFQITVTNTVQVDGGAPAGSFIEKMGMSIVVPEPSTLLLLVGCIPLIPRRLRRRV